MLRFYRSLLCDGDPLWANCATLFGVLIGMAAFFYFAVKVFK